MKRKIARLIKSPYPASRDLVEGRFSLAGYTLDSTSHG